MLGGTDDMTILKMGEKEDERGKRREERVKEVSFLIL
jgi:hypothetical protein